VELNGFNDAAAAKQEIKAAWDAWKAKIRNKRKNRHRPVPVAFSSPYCPQNEAIRYESADDPRFDANAGG
jgi:allophanate hydrolase subunit 1